MKLLIAAVLLVPFARAAEPDWAAAGRKYMVAADHPLASEAGARVLARGGNAVDAAAAVSFAQAVVRPYSTGLGGGGFMLIHLRGREPVALDYRETAPAGASAELYLDGEGKPIPDKSVYGHWAAGVPGLVRGVAYALDRFGTLRLRDALEPAIRLAEKGFPVDADTHEAMRDLAEKAKGPGGERFAEAARIFLRKGEPYPVGAILAQPDLARTLRRLAVGGPEEFYRGPIAAAIAEDMQKHGGPMTRADLEGYRALERAPLRGVFRDHGVLGMPPPSSGGAALIQILHVFNGYPAKSLSAADFHHVLAESMKHAFADRAAFLGDPDARPEVARDAQAMISLGHAVKVRAAIDLKKVRDPGRYGRLGLKDDSGTSHYGILDAAGNAVACTETINLHFGAMIVPPGTGIVLNNELDDFALKPGVPNSFGLQMSERNLLRPGARPLSSMSPTILYRGKKAVLAAGASGGPRIISATAQVILNVLERGMSAAEAIAAPRIHHQWRPDVLRAEADLKPELAEHLKSLGHALETTREKLAAAQLVWAAGGRIYGASDPRKGGKPAGR